MIFRDNCESLMAVSPRYLGGENSLKTFTQEEADDIVIKTRVTQDVSSNLGVCLSIMSPISLS